MGQPLARPVAASWVWRSPQRAVAGFTLSSLSIVGGNPTPYRIQCLGEDESGELYFGTKTMPGVLELDANGKLNGGLRKLVLAVTTSTAVLQANQDNTMFAESNTRSNGVGPYLFSGVTASSTNYATRRAFGFL